MAAARNGHSAMKALAALLISTIVLTGCEAPRGTTDEHPVYATCVNR
ncbi:lipoprotein domain protein [Mycobacterium phage Indlulamithi]|uniref:Lipoprotein domain protein n=1 Tax=Mycobacterium phage Indlulamithi TaxID=2656582 RepID=A0A649VDE1_9CAUD|nr:lipoprotein domain protein [Mycobacterium phage Indlulamithi]QGJ90095.1 lipoprotein domain protein [Mycobacterium phage Indlulamithi]